MVGGTPYEGGYFRVKFQFTDEFPAAPPKCSLTPHQSLCLTISLNRSSSIRSHDDQDIPPQCFFIWRDLCEYTEEGLAVHLRHCAHTGHREVPLDLSQSRERVG